MLQINKAFSYPFEDREWPIKILVGTALSAFPIASFITVGYSYRIFKWVLNGEEPYMPEWDDFKTLLIQGFWLFLINLCYIIVPMVVGFFGLFVILLGIPFVMFDNSTMAVGAITILVGIFIIVISFFLGLLVMFMYPMAVANYAKNDEKFAAAFSIFEILKKTFTVFGNYFLAFVVLYSAFFLMIIVLFFPLVGMFVSLLFVFFIYFISYLLWPALFGSACAGAFLEDMVTGTAVKQKVKKVVKPKQP